MNTEFPGINESLRRRIGALSPEKQLLLEELVHKRRDARRCPPRIPKRDVFSPAPMSFSQHGMWLMDQLAPNNHFYNLPAAISLRPAISPAISRKILEELLSRHEALRTTFMIQDGEPVQVVSPTPNLALSFVDLRHLPAAQRTLEAERLATLEIKRPFDLAQGPLLRATSYRLDEQRDVLVLTIHHIAADAWSMDILFREFGALVAAYRSGRPSRLPDLPIQYPDFAVWQKEWLKSGLLEAQLSYWKEALAGLYPIQLPTDAPRKQIRTFLGSTFDFSFSRDLTASLTELSKREGVTLFILLLACLQTLVFRYTGETDVGIGCPISGRNRPETEGVIGLFLNTLVLRVDLAGNPTFRELLTRVRTAAVAAFANQDIPFEKLIQELRPGRDPGSNGLFNILFQLFTPPPSPSTQEQNGPNDDLKLVRDAGLYDFVVTLREVRGALFGGIEYCTELFQRDTISGFVHHLKMLVEQILRDPDQKVASISLLQPKERQTLLTEWSTGDRASLPKHSCFHQLFEQQAERTPDAIALVFQDQQLTYGKLNTLVNQLAHHLQTHGVGPEVLVGILVRKSIEMITSVLATLKASGAYLPLDETTPPARLATILNDAKPDVLIVEHALMPQVAVSDLPKIAIDTDSPVIALNSKTNLNAGVRPNNAAYVIYTSGSTGTPKGVLIEHRGLSNIAEAQVNILGLTDRDRVFQFAPLAFDASIADIVMAFRAGATLFLGSREETLPGPPLVEFLQKNAITVATFPPSVLELLAPEQLPALRTIIVAGEPCPAALVDEWLPGRRVFNFYGPTEASVWSAAYRCNAGEHRPPIGRPIQNVVVYILDPELQPVPIGVPGELYIGGEGVAREYLNRPELTAERFIANPFNAESAPTLYKTGDRARYRADGNIEFLGRFDNQIKLRGFRIEPEEIEAALIEHPNVRRAAVLVTDLSTARRLTAYIVPTNDDHLASDVLIGFLKQKLPDYMVPKQFMIVPALPLTKSGKLDRIAVRDLDARTCRQSEQYVGPRYESEAVIAQIWKEFLKTEQIGIHDNFFDIGGHSLLMVKVYSKLREVTNREISIVDLFRYPTISTLAAYLNGARPLVPDADPSKHDERIPA